MNKRDDFNVIIVGSGIGGICLGKKLRDLGVRQVLTGWQDTDNDNHHDKDKDNDNDSYSDLDKDKTWESGTEVRFVPAVTAGGSVKVLSVV